ncbi:CLNS1A family protein [Megaselia abdita]
MSIQEIQVPVENCLFSSQNVTFKVNEQILGSGDLYLSANSLQWKPHDKPQGLSFPWLQIQMHGVRDSSNSTDREIYFMIEDKFIWEGVYNPSQSNGNSHDDHMEEDDDGSSDTEMTEFFIKPTNGDVVQEIYNAMNECTRLNPDPNDEISPDEDDELDCDEYDDDDEDRGGPNDLNDPISYLNINAAQFDDAEED